MRRRMSHPSFPGCAHLISYVPSIRAAITSLFLYSQRAYFLHPLIRIGEPERREFVHGITMNRDCHPANCDITPPSGSLSTPFCLRRDRGADMQEQEEERVRTLAMVDGSENEIPRREAAGQIPFTYVRAGTHSACI